MGNSVFWYYPDPKDGTAQRIDVGRKVTDRKGPTPTVQQSVSSTYTGIQTTLHYGGNAQIQVQCTGRLGPVLGEGRVLRRQLYNMVNHLQRGGYVVFAEDEDIAFCAFASRLISRGANVIPYYVNLFENLNTLNDVSTQELVIQSDYQSYITEMKYCSAHDLTAHKVTVNNVALDYHDTRWCLVREYGSWIALRLPEEKRNGEFLSHDHEIVFYLDLPLEEDVATIEVMAQSIFPGLSPPSSDGVTPGGPTGAIPTGVGTFNPGAGWTW